MIRLTEKDDTVRFEILVQPRAGRNQIVGELDGAIKIRIAAPPVEGEANEACMRFLAKLLDLRLSDIGIVSGLSARRKIISVRGMTSAKLSEKLSQHVISGR
jgi:uncharacterized protein